MRGLHELPARDDTGAFRVVIESPRGSGVKLKYEPGLGAFAFDREVRILGWGDAKAAEALVDSARDAAGQSR